jgi:hypothetical protein
VSFLSVVVAVLGATTLPRMVVVVVAVVFLTLLLLSQLELTA